MLVPLQIPSGWKVLWNTWFNEPPCLDDGSENLKHNDSPNLLLLERIQLQQPEDNSSLRFDLGWHYETPGYKKGSRKAGWYKLTAYMNTWENIIRIKDKLSFEQAKNEIELWLVEVSENKFDQ